MNENEVRTARLDEFPGYIFFEDGRIWTEKKEKFLKPEQRGNGKCYYISPVNSSGKHISKKMANFIYHAFNQKEHIDSVELEHIDHDVSNNALSNLKKVDDSRKSFPTVHYYKKTNKFCVKILCQHYGLFSTHLEAVLHSIRIHQQLNIPLSPLQISYIQSNNINIPSKLNISNKTF